MEKKSVSPARTSTGLAIWLNTLGAMIRKELLLMTRYPVELFADFSRYLLMIAIFTFAMLTFTTDGSEASAATVRISGVGIYGFILFSFFNETLWHMSDKIRVEQLQGTLEQLYMSPAAKSASLISRVVAALMWSGGLSFLVMGLISLLVGKLPLANIPLSIFILLMTLMGTFGVGFAFAAVTLRVQQTANTLKNLLEFMFMVFCAPFFPFNVLPEWAKMITRLIPLSYGVDAFRSSLLDYPAGFPELASIEVELTIVTIFGLLMPILGLWLYHREAKLARQKGSLGTY